MTPADGSHTGANHPAFAPAAEAAQTEQAAGPPYGRLAYYSDSLYLAKAMEPVFTMEPIYAMEPLQTFFQGMICRFLIPATGQSWGRRKTVADDHQESLHFRSFSCALRRP